VLFTIVALGAAALAGPALAATTTATAKVKPQKVTVTASEYRFAITKKAFKTGTVTFTVRNKGTEVHDFKVNGKSPKSRFLAPGQSQTLRITFTKPGRYQYLCTIGEHAIRGMQGVIVVTK
jgi:plastocyanin